MNNIVEVNNLVKHYYVHEKEAGLKGSLKSFFNRNNKIIKAVDNISLRIAPGEIVGFLGSNGSGKTTTLKMLSGLLHPTEGQIKVAGFTPKYRQHGFLSSITLVMGQKQQLDWDLCAEDSFLLHQAIYEIPDRTYRRRVAEMTEMLELKGLLNKQVRKLSLGERMKCELAIALLHQPKIVFLDEPTIGLDVNMQQAVREFIAQYNEYYGATIILTSHYMADLTALAKRILVINSGKLIFDGDLKSFTEQKAPHKVLKLQFIEPQPAHILRRYGTVRSHVANIAELLVEHVAVTKTAVELLKNLPVADISIEDIPIEEVVREVFRSGQVKLKHSNNFEKS
ncbi:ABC transporter [Dulcicalothrix desertica PCC 7102]|uniref:ABC transporter n=1 Tax=Dulcicalothrix desertica PCC 7102 TaxID=232991 RepID=A0A433UN77_9CYAN|nr:ATP-binding cassette domain-containing protein [Dulcicalothrix desertica]RUS95294.1 ABC transporter [Dulcicalothrix desertica PCC 7102]TWH43982.1 ABC-2 type transport system ATP-binding protein [Dulcicalothrix desertica PCC 7102]